MGADTQPLFIIGSGRCGTRTFYKMLSGVPDLEIHHEYVCTHVQKVAALYYMGCIDKPEAMRRMAGLHGAAVYYSPAGTWADASNKLSWLIEPLVELLPDARFLFLTRDGRKVVSSFYYKLDKEMYDNRSTDVLRRWLEDPALPEPPPEKKYWWNIPRSGQFRAEEFPAYNRYQRVCWHWTEVNQRILRDLDRFVSPSRWFQVKLEAFTREPAQLRETLEFLGVEYDEDYREYLKTPQNVLFPVDFRLTEEQMAWFREICDPMMRRLGYEEEDVYTVQY